jgi:serine/threonine protein kinase
LREAQAMARLAHPNVVAIFDAGEVDGQVFIAMELVDGTTLRKWLGEPRDVAAILETFVAAGRGLAAAHGAGLVHRDFKPENVLIGGDGRVRVTDFGLARRTEEPTTERHVAPSITGHDLTVTVTGAMLGTPAYMAPEQFRGEDLDARSDQFSFCVALYEAVYASRPFAGQTWEAIAAEVISGEPRTPPPDIAPPSVWAALARGLSAHRDDRFPSMNALLDALAGEPLRHAKPRVGAWLAGVTLGVAALAGGAALWTRAGKEPQAVVRTATPVAPTPTPVAPLSDPVAATPVAIASPPPVATPRHKASRHAARHSHATRDATSVDVDQPIADPWTKK